MRGFLVTAVALVAMATSAAAQNLIVTESAFGVAETMDRLEAELTERGIGIAARVDHAKAAGTVEMELRPTQLMIFGSPRLGTPLMQSNPTIGIDLPLKALAWEDEAGTVWFATNDPAFLQERHAIGDRDEAFGMMGKVLEALTAAATREE